MNRPPRSEQAIAVLKGQGRRMASTILGRRANTADDFAEAFNLERVDLLSEVRTPERLFQFARTVVGPRDGLYVIDDGDDGYRVYHQERGEILTGVGGADFDTAAETAVGILVTLNGIPWEPPG